MKKVALYVLTTKTEGEEREGYIERLSGTFSMCPHLNTDCLLDSKEVWMALKDYPGTKILQVELRETTPEEVRAITQEGLIRALNLSTEELDLLQKV